jgi:hypothetical protein
MTALAAQLAHAAALTVAHRRKAAGVAHCLDLIDRLRGQE